MSECNEVASSMRTAGAPVFARFDDAVAYVRWVMPGESYTVVDNVAAALWGSHD